MPSSVQLQPKKNNVVHKAIISAVLLQIDKSCTRTRNAETEFPMFIW